MGNGHRPGHRGGGREGGPSHPRGERILVLPGEEIPGNGLRPGTGTYRLDGKIYASVLGLLNRQPPLVKVTPLSGRYIPKPNDVVLGTVTDVQTTFWLLDISAPRWAPLHMSGSPWKMEVGETKLYLKVGDAVAVAVESLEATGRIGVTMNGEGLGKLEGGTIITISPAKVPRVIGRGGSMINTITRLTGTRVAVGQNGRIWIDGPPDGITRVREALRMIEEEGQRAGLTERIHQYLEATSDPSAQRTRPRSTPSLLGSTGFSGPATAPAPEIPRGLPPRPTAEAAEHDPEEIVPPEEPPESTEPPI
ncbi:MAG: exosome complex RNA-binding protein Rrp4 [Thermoplasmata archaeon]